MSTRSWATALVMVALVSLGLAQGAAAQEEFPLKQCGTLHDFFPATPTTSGTIGIGSRTFQIAIGATTPALPLGQPACVSGQTLASQIFVTVSVGPLPTEACGAIRVVVPPSGGTSGGLAIGSGPELIVKIPAMTTLPPDLEGSTRCVSLQLDAAGDLAYVSVRSALPGTSTTPPRAGDGGVAWPALVGALAASFIALAAYLVRRGRRAPSR